MLLRNIAAKVSAFLHICNELNNQREWPSISFQWTALSLMLKVVLTGLRLTVICTAMCHWSAQSCVDYAGVSQYNFIAIQMCEINRNSMLDMLFHKNYLRT